MTEILKRVLQRKRGFLNKFLANITESQLEELHSFGLLNEDVDKIPNANGTVPKMMDFINISNSDNATDFLEFLQQEYVWLYEEVTIEVKAETCDLELDDYEVEEAATLVHRCFGQSRRLSERDKKTMASLVATKGQVAKDTWKTRLTELQRVLEEVKTRLAEKEKAIQECNKFIQTFLNHHQVELHDYSMGLKSTSQTLLEMKSPREDAFDVYFRRISFIVDRFRKTLFERQSYINQKNECLKLLNSSDLRTPLNAILTKTIDSFTKEKQKNMTMIKRLEMKNASLEKEVKQKDALICELKCELGLLQIEIEKKKETEDSVHEIENENSSKKLPVPPSPKHSLYSPNPERRVVPPKRAAMKEKQMRMKQSQHQCMGKHRK